MSWYIFIAPVLSLIHGLFNNVMNITLERTVLATGLNQIALYTTFTVLYQMDKLIEMCLPSLLRSEILHALQIIAFV